MITNGPWKTLGKKYVHQNPYWKVRDDAVIDPSGQRSHYYVVEQPDFVCICPISDDGRELYLVRLWRYAVAKNFWEVPMGYIDRGETPLQAARRELEEETGFRAGSCRKIGFSYIANGFSTQAFHVYVATDFTKGVKCLESGEQGMITKRMALTRINQMIASGELTDSPTITSLYFLQQYLKKL